MLQWELHILNFKIDLFGIREKQKVVADWRVDY